MKTKKFDCVEMKNEIQAQLYDEYIATKDKYESYAHFIEERTKNSAWAQQMMRRFKTTGTQSK